jgi:Flp pilus assembly secretin CpaC/tetratricopeptide (TPR) repeat protein
MCPKVFNFCPHVSSVFSSQVVYADTNDQSKVKEYYKTARQYYKESNYEEAIAECRKIFEINTYNASARKLIKKSEERLQKLEAKKIEEQRDKEKQIEKEAEKKKQEKINGLLKNARQLYKDKDYKQALTIYREILKIDPWNKKALKMAERARGEIGISEREVAEKTSKLAKQKAAEDAEKEAGLIALQKKKIEERRQIEKEELESRIKAHYENGKKLYRNDEYSDAIGEFKTVLAIDSAHEGAKEYLTASEESLKEQNKRKSVRHAKTAKKEIARKDRLRKRDIRDKITDAKIEADTGEYDEAIKILEGVLPNVLDENLRRSVELLISRIRTEKTVKEEKLNQKRLQTISDERMLEVTKAQLPPAEVKRMKELKHKKKKADASRELKDKASSIKVPLVKYTGADLRDVVLFLIKQTGVNIVVDEAMFSGGSTAPAVPAAEGAEGWGGETAAATQPTGPVNTKVTCFLQDMTLLSVLEAILRPKGLDYKFTKEYIWIATKAKMLAQPLEDLETRVYSLEYGSSMNITRLTESGFKNTVETQTTGGGEGVADGVSGESVKELLETLVPQPTGASITVQSELNKLFVKNTPENLNKTEKILAELRTPVQVSIEARYVYVRLQEGEEIGIGFTDIDKSWEMGGKHGATEVKTGSGTEQYMTGGSHETHTIDSATILSGISGLATTGLNMTYAAVLNEIQFTAVLKALQHRTDTNTLSAPKLTVLNNKPGIVRFVETVTYVDTVTSTTTAATATAAAITSYDYTFTEKDVGMILNVTPQVNEATKCVTLFLQPQISNVESWSTPYYSSSSDTTGYRKPNFYSKDIETYVTVHDGDTVVLGGFMEDTAGKTVYKVPFLSDIPLLGKLFQTKSKSGDKKKLLIFVTVNILDASGSARIAQ